MKKKKKKKSLPPPNVVRRARNAFYSVNLHPVVRNQRDEGLKHASCATCSGNNVEDGEGEDNEEVNEEKRREEFCFLWLFWLL
ncbi:hypothetical protein GGU11DRAFT_751602 [Lentinula aff. detonsa]|nr:hypothetical protein GGU11DRAFT_751602 [Lentinula aff. detonsa]